MSTEARGRCSILTYARPEFGPLGSLNSSGACATLHTASIKKPISPCFPVNLVVDRLAPVLGRDIRGVTRFTPNPAIVRAGVAMIARSIGSRRANIASTSCPGFVICSETDTCPLTPRQPLICTDD